MRLAGGSSLSRQFQIDASRDGWWENGQSCRRRARGASEGSTASRLRRNAEFSLGQSRALYIVRLSLVVVVRYVS